MIPFTVGAADIESLANLSEERKYFLTNCVCRKPLPDIDTLTDASLLDQCACSLTGLDAIVKDICYDLRLLKHIEASDDIGLDEALYIYDKVSTDSY